MPKLVNMVSNTKSYLRMELNGLLFELQFSSLFVETMIKMECSRDFYLFILSLLTLFLKKKPSCIEYHCYCL